MRFLPPVGLILTAAAFPVAVHAQQIRISQYTGASFTDSTSLHVVQPTTNSDAVFDKVGFRGRAWETSPYYGFRVETYFSNRSHWGIDFDYNHYKVYAKVEDSTRVHGIWNGAPVDTVAPIDDRVQSFNITNGVNVYSIDLLFRLMERKSAGFPDGRIRPYVSFGPSYYTTYEYNTVNNIYFDHRGQHPRGFGWQARVGMQYGLSRRWSLFTDIKRTEAYQKHIYTAPYGEGRSTLNLDTWHIVGGFNYSF